MHRIDIRAQVFAVGGQTFVLAARGQSKITTRAINKFNGRPIGISAPATARLPGLKQRADRVRVRAKTSSYDRA